MAKKVSIVITDDLDGSPDAQTVTFGLDGVTYEIDLTAANRAKLAAALEPFVGAGRRTRRGGRRRAPGGTAARRADRAAVRAWARRQGLAISERGRLSVEVIRRYDEAH